MKTKINFKRIAGYFFITFSILFLLTSCAEVVSIEECLGDKTYGFWSGLLHGVISPFSFIVSLFKDDVAVYAVNNSGKLYNLGFLLGAAIIFGSGGNASKRKRK